MGCLHSNLKVSDHEDILPNDSSSCDEQRPSQLVGHNGAPEEPWPASSALQLHGIKLHGTATTGDAASAALLCSRLIVTRGHILAAVFEGNASPAAAEYCRMYCWEAFVQAAASWQQVPAAATLRTLDRGFLTSSQHSLDTRLATSCSATLVHVDLAACTVTTATVGAHGTVALGCVDLSSPLPATRMDEVNGRGARGASRGQQQQAAGASRERQQQQAGRPGDVSLSGVGESGARGRVINRVVTLEAARGEERRGLSGLVDVTASTLAIADASTAAVPSGSGGLARGIAVPRASPPFPTLLRDAAQESTSPDVGRPSTGDNSTSISTAAAVNPTTTFHTHIAVPAAGARFAALSRLHCGCDVRVSSRQLAPGDECILLLAGSGGTGPPRSGGGGGSNITGGVGSVDVGTGPVGSGPRPCIGSSSSSQMLGSSQVGIADVCCGPAGALSAGDAVILAHEMASRAVSAMQLARSDPGAKSNRFDVLYDSYDAEAAALREAQAAGSGAAATAAGAAGGSGGPSVSAATAACSAASACADRGALAVASYAAAAAAARSHATDMAVRGLGAACLVMWLDWGPAGGPTATPTRPRHSPTLQHVELSPALRRWQLLRAYCRFRLCRRRRLLSAWQQLVATVMAPSPPVPHGHSPVPSWLPVQMATGAAGALPGSIESVGSSPPPAVAMANRTASFTSRAPVMMEFVEELPSPDDSATVIACSLAAGPATSPAGPELLGVAGGACTPSRGPASAAAAAVGSPAPLPSVAVATLDASLTASASSPYGISGLVVAPMSSSDEDSELDYNEDDETRARAALMAAAAAGAPRSFVLRADPSHRRLAELTSMGTLRTSHSSPDLKGMEDQGPAAAATAAAAASTSTHGRPVRHMAVEVLMPPTPHLDALAAAVDASDSPSYSSQYVTARGAAGGTTRDALSAGGTGGGGGSGGIDWSLIMTNLPHSSVPRGSNSAGHTPIPSATASRFPHAGLPEDSGLGSPQGSGAVTGGGSGATSSGQGAAPSGELAPVPASGGYLPIPGGTAGSSYVRRQKSVPHTATYSSPLSVTGYGQRGLSRTSVSSTLGGGSGSSSELVASGRPAAHGGIASKRFVTASASPGPTSVPPCVGSPDQDADYEAASEDLPQLRIESTAELAALMAEIIITEDGQVVRMGGGSGGGMPPPYTGRNHGLQLGHKSSRSLSRQGSRGWTPRLAIVREDAREATTSTSASQLLAAEVARFSAISEERTSQGSSSGTTERAQSLCSGSDHQSSAASSGQSRANPIAGNGSPPSSMEDPTMAFGTMAPATLVASAAPSPAIATASAAASTFALAAGPIAAVTLASCSQSALATSQATTHSHASPWLSPFVKPPVHLEPELYHSPTRATRSTGSTDDAALGAAPHGASASSASAPASGPGPHFGQAHTLATSSPSPRAPLVTPYGDTSPAAAASLNTAAAAKGAAVDSLASVMYELTPSLNRERLAGFSELQHSGSDMVISNVAGQVHPQHRLATAPGIVHEGVFSEAQRGGAANTLCVSAASSVSLADGLPITPPTTTTTHGSETGAFAEHPTGRATSSRPRKLGRNRSRSSTQLSSLAAGRDETASHLASEDVEYEDSSSSRTAGIAHGDVAGDAARQRVGVGLVGRSHSMLVGRAAQALHSRHHLQQQYAHPQDRHKYTAGVASGQAQSHPYGTGRQLQLYHGANTHNTRHLYGLSDMTSQQQQGASPVPSARVGLYSTVANVAAGVGEMLSLGTFQTGTLDRTWSMGSTSGPLGSLLHSTTSKSSLTGLMSTAVPTPVCNSAAGSGSRLLIFNTTPAISVTSAVPAAAGAAAAVVDSSDAPCFRSTHPSLSNSRQEPGIVAGIRLAAAKPLHLAPVEDTPATTVQRPAWPPRTSPHNPAPPATSPTEPCWLPSYPLATHTAGAVYPESSHQAERPLSTPPLSPHASNGTVTLAPASTATPAGQSIDPSNGCSSSVAVAPSRDTLMLPASYGMPGGGSGAAGPLADAALACSEDGGSFPHVSRSDASCTVGWNSASAWIASTTASTAGRTGDMAGLTGGLGGNSSRRVVLLGGMGMGGSSFTCASAALGGGMGIGIGVGGGDTSGLIACNPAYSSVSGLLVTADTGLQSSNTQLLFQMGLSTQQPAPSPATLMAQAMGVSTSSTGAAGPLQLTPLPPPPQQYPQHPHSPLMHPGVFLDNPASSFALCGAGPASGAGHSASSNAAHLGQLLVGSSLRATGTSPRQAGGTDPCLGQLLGGLGMLQEDAAGQDDEAGE